MTGGRQIRIHNRQAGFDYELLERLEAGIALQGTEVKSVRAGQVRISEAFVVIRNGEAWLTNAHISHYAHGNSSNHETDATRKLLLHRSQIRQLESSVKERGYSIVPTALYFARGRVKVEIALAKGKKNHDKRECIKGREAAIEIKSALKQALRR